MATKNKVELARQLGRSMSEMRTAIRQFLQQKVKENNLDISFELLEVLAYLHTNNGVNQQVLADMMVKDKSSMTYLINNLVKRDMVVRTEDENDRRNKLIFLKKEGQDYMEKINPWVLEIYRRASAGIDIAAIEDALSLAGNMNKNLKNNV